MRWHELSTAEQWAILRQEEHEVWMLKHPELAARWEREAGADNSPIWDTIKALSDQVQALHFEVQAMRKESARLQRFQLQPNDYTLESE